MKKAVIIVGRNYTDHSTYEVAKSVLEGMNTPVSIFESTTLSLPDLIDYNQKSKDTIENARKNCEAAGFYPFTSTVDLPQLHIPNLDEVKANLVRIYETLDGNSVEINNIANHLASYLTVNAIIEFYQFIEANHIPFNGNKNAINVESMAQDVKNAIAQAKEGGITFVFCDIKHVKRLAASLKDHNLVVTPTIIRSNYCFGEPTVPLEADGVDIKVTDIHVTECQCEFDSNPFADVVYNTLASIGRGAALGDNALMNMTYDVTFGDGTLGQKLDALEATTASGPATQTPPKTAARPARVDTPRPSATERLAKQRARRLEVAQIRAGSTN